MFQLVISTSRLNLKKTNKQTNKNKTKKQNKTKQVMSLLRKTRLIFKHNSLPYLKNCYKILNNCFNNCLIFFGVKK